MSFCLGSKTNVDFMFTVMETVGKIIYSKTKNKYKQHTFEHGKPKYT